MKVRLPGLALTLLLSSTGCSEPPHVFVFDEIPKACALPETCDGKDNDCDGIIDESPTALEPSSNQQGLCKGWRKRCVEGRQVDPPAPEDESYSHCDGLDNDCDGAVDEWFTNEKYEQYWGCATVGDYSPQCRTKAKRHCVSGVYIGCAIRIEGADGESVYLPPFEAPETCDGYDNDCDGTVDEEIQFDPDTPCTPRDSTLQGPCARGTPRCEDGREVCHPVEPQTESCNGIDDDCNGEVDDVEGVGTECDAGLPAHCASIWQCVDDPEPKCVPSRVEPERCDDVDNDCDGEPDEEDASQAPLCTSDVDNAIGHCIDGACIQQCSQDFESTDDPEMPLRCEKAHWRSVSIVDDEDGLHRICGVLGESGRVRCWGPRAIREAPLPDDVAFKQVVATDFHTCGLTREGGRVICAALDPIASNRVPFAQEPEDGVFVQLVGAGPRICALHVVEAQHSIWCSTTPERPIALENDRVRRGRLTAGSMLCAIVEPEEEANEADRLRCWGGAANEEIEFGAGAGEAPTPVKLDHLSQAQIGRRHLCTVRRGRVHCYGFSHGSRNPMPLSEIALAESINAASEGEPPNMSLLAVSNERACGASDGHPLRCWRLVAGAAGEVAGDLTPLPPTINRDNQRVLALTMGLLGNTACVLLGDRTLECWSTTENQPLDIWPHQDP